MYLFYIIFFVVRFTSATEDTQNIEHCNTLQYAEYGKPTTIECIFLEGFYGVFWFNSTDYINQFPLVTLKKSVKGGHGYDSGEFDISSNGSLIINKVLPRHEHNYTVFKLDSVESKIKPHFIFLNVTENVMGQPCESQQFLELGKTGYLKCSFTKPFFGIFWFDNIDHVNNVPVAMLKESGKSGNGYQAGEYDISPHGSLVINRVSPLHEKSFTVYKLETVDSRVKPIFINVVVYAFPIPLHPVINDCPHQQCVVESPHKGSLRCIVNGIRPIVKLLWKMANEEPLHKITFYDHNYTIETKGGVYDVMLTSRFVVNDTSVSRLNVECSIVFEEKNDLFSLTSEAHLLLVTENMENESSDTKSTKVTWIAVVVVVFLIIAGAIISAGTYRKRKSHQKGKDGPDGTVMKPLLAKNKAKIKKRLIKELISHYKKIYSKVQYFPLRVLKSNFPVAYCKSFINLLIKSDEQENRKTRKPLSYSSFFSDPYFKGKTFVLTGESGCGKSTFSQQLAYDWCIKPNVSLQQRVEILILLPFRHFVNITSMYEAIKKIYFSKHSDINEELLESILSESLHVLIILDGYDEYPQIISHPRKIVQTSTEQKKSNFTIIITSGSCLEEGSISNDNEQVSLIACTTSIRDTNSCKKEEIKDVKGIETMESYLETNPFMACLCSFPLFFVLADVLSFEENNVQSVSGFLKEIIVSFQRQSMVRPASHLTSVKAFEDNYCKLGGEAFRKMGSQDKSDTCVWRKEDISEIIDSECFEMLLKSGILAEEKVTSGDYEPVFYVKVCHSILLEWFSAIYIANKLKSDDDYNMDMLREDLSFYKPVYYFYLFLLELSEKTVVEQLMKILEKRENFREFLILFKRNNVEYEAEALKLIESYVSEKIKISFKDSRMKQQFILCIMKIASGFKKPTVCLCLEQTFNSAELSSSKIYLKSGLLLPALPSLKELRIDENGRRLTEGETVSVINFAVTCEGVTNLRFSHCLLPYKLEKEFPPATTIKVTWTPVSSLAVYTFCFESGQWQRKDSPLTEDDYLNIESTISK